MPDVRVLPFLGSCEPNRIVRALSCWRAPAIQGAGSPPILGRSATCAQGRISNLLRQFNWVVTMFEATAASKACRVMLIEDDPDDVFLFERALDRVRAGCK